MDAILKAGALGLLVVCGCSDNLTPPSELSPWEAPDPVLAECFPNLDGVIDSDELSPAIGVPVRYRVTAAGAEESINLAGSRDAIGNRVWDLSSPFASDRELEISAKDVEDEWYANEFPGGEFATPLDGASREFGIYSHHSDGIFLHGFASATPDPTSGRTLMKYENPVQVFAFPMKRGDEWISVGDINGGEFRGLPYAGRDTYTSEVSDEGEVWLPSIEFTDTLQVKTLVQVQPAVGQSTSRVQVSWIFECFGEVARAVSLDGESDLNFSRTSELRRLGF